MTNISIPYDVYDQLSDHIGAIYGLADALFVIDSKAGLDELGDESRSGLLHQLFLHSKDLHGIFGKTFIDAGRLESLKKECDTRKEG